MNWEGHIAPTLSYEMLQKCYPKNNKVIRKINTKMDSEDKILSV